MKKFFNDLIVLVTAICFSVSALALTLKPVDREIHYSREDQQNPWTVLNDGQWHPTFGYIEIHEIDKALVLQFDLSGYQDEIFGNAEVGFFITDLVNNRTHNIVNINLRFAGSYEDGWDGNIFVPPDGRSNDHFARFSASETNPGFRPYLILEQGPVGNIAGSVSTSVTGQTSAIKGAFVTIVEKGRGTETDGNGAYVFNNVSVGTWTLKIQKPGFETLILPGITVSGGQTANGGDIQMDFDTVWDMNDDGRKGLPEAIDALQTAAGLR